MRALVPVLVVLFICLAAVAMAWLMTRTSGERTTKKALKNALSELHAYRQFVLHLHDLALTNRGFDPFADITSDEIRKFQTNPSTWKKEL